MRTLKRWVALLLVVFTLAVSLSAVVLAASGDTTVYITKTGEKYHSYGCQYLRQSCISISLSQAVSSGYGRCSKCSPPYLDQSTTTTTPATTTQSSSTSSSSGSSSGSAGSSGSSGSSGQQSTSASSGGAEKKYTQYELDMAVAMANTKARDDAEAYYEAIISKADLERARAEKAAENAEKLLLDQMEANNDVVAEAVAKLEAEHEAEIKELSDEHDREQTVTIVSAGGLLIAQGAINSIRKKKQ